tara:strand:+ start:232 stop:582 length:351 start_codon:yes stop_codon:yes gene_type:complete
MFNNICSGAATLPTDSILAGIFTITVISRSVDLIVVSFSETLIKTEFKIGRVDLLGVALESFWSADCSSFLEVENFILFVKNFIVIESIKSTTQSYLKTNFLSSYFQEAGCLIIIK